MQIFDDQSKNMIMDWAQSLKNQIKIKLITKEHVENNQFINFTKKITDTASELTIDSEKGEKDLPYFQLNENIKELDKNNKQKGYLVILLLLYFVEIAYNKIIN